MNYRVLTYARLAADAYNDSSEPLAAMLQTKGWRRLPLEVPKQPLFSGGFYARLYGKFINEHDTDLPVDTFVVSIRGTMLNTWTHAVTNLLQDGEILIHVEPGYYKVAQQFYNDARSYIVAKYIHTNKLKSFSVKLTGHSLGGILAKLVGVRSNARAVAFNASGIGRWVQLRDYREQLLNVSAASDLVKQHGHTLGQLKTILVPHGKAIYQTLTDPRELTLMACAGGEGSTGAGVGAAMASGLYYAGQQHKMQHLIAALEENREVGNSRF